jgi:hypothetical protein
LKLSTTLPPLVLGGAVAVARGGTGVLVTAVVAVAGGLVGTCVGVLVGGGVAVAVAVAVAVGDGVGVSVAMKPDSLAGSRFD